MKRAIVFAAILMFAHVCLAMTIHVPADQPTIQAGIDAAVNGDTVLVAPGSYPEQIDYKGKGIVVTSSDGPEVTFLNPSNTPVVTFVSNEPSGAELSGFTIRATSDGFRMMIQGGSKPLIQGNIFANLSTSVALVYCELAHPRIVRNLFYRNSITPYWACIAVISGSADIINNTFYGNSSRGFDSWSWSGSTIAKNNIVTRSTQDGIYGDFAEVSYNDVWKNKPDYGGGTSPGLGSISADPQFVNPDLNDFRLRATSPCIDAGDPDPSYNDPDGTRNDMGAFPQHRLPIASGIDFGTTQHGDTVASPNPTVHWEFLDVTNTVQVAYELEVGTDDEWTVAEMWSTGVVVTGADSVTYAGSPLSDHTSYYLRLRLFNGAHWGDWLVERFFVDPVRVIYVPTDRPTIQQGIDASTDRDTVFIADGHYYERINFRGKNIVVGSYFLIDRDTMHIANTVIDGDTTVLGVSDSGSVVSFMNGEDSTTVLAGVTIVNGIGLNDHGASPRGGGIICKNVSPSIENCSFIECSENQNLGGAIAALVGGHVRIHDCLFVGNLALWGGAVYSDGTSVKIRNCVFANNSADVGGAVFSLNRGVEIEDCSFIENRASSGGAALGWGLVVRNSIFLRNQVTSKGGAIWAYFGATITGCWFEENLAKEPGYQGAGSGGAIGCGAQGDSVRIENCTFVRNSAGDDGGAISGVFYNGAIVHCAFKQNSAIWGGGMRLSANNRSNYFFLDSCTFDGNAAVQEGGAMAITSADLLKIRSCSFVRNSAPSASWLSIHPNNHDEVVSPVFEDCLVAFNRGGSIVSPADSGWLIPTLSCSDIYGNSGGDWISYIASQADSNGNFSADPLFCDTASGDFHLQGNSPCAPANNSCGVLIGALPVACGWGCGDIDGSGGVNVTDAVHLIYYLFSNGSEPLDLSAGDVNQDGRLNIADVVYLINYIFVGGPAPCATGK